MNKEESQMNQPAQTPTYQPTGTAAAARQTTVMSAVIVISLGMLFIVAAGFGQAATLHDATHDIRHAHSLPCH